VKRSCRLRTRNDAIDPSRDIGRIENPAVQQAPAVPPIVLSLLQQQRAGSALPRFRTSAVPTTPSNVGCWGHTGKHLLVLSYAGEWVRQSFEKRSITYTASELPKSGLYVDFLPKLNSKMIRLVDNPRLVNQIAALERRTSRGGKDSVDHPPQGHDDLANVVAGVTGTARVQSRCECSGQSAA
jgi:hypothetical protein